MKRIISFIAVCLIVFLMINLLVMLTREEKQAYPLEAPIAFNSTYRLDYREKVELEQPAVIIVGDSTVDRYEEQVFSEVFNQPTLVFSFSGSSSAHWQLFLRRAVLEGAHQPDMVIIFFRDSVLTTPYYLVLGSYYIRLEEVGAAQDADIYALAITSQKSTAERFFEKYLPIYAFRSEIYFNLIRDLQNLLPSLLVHCDDACVENALDQVFDEPNINDALREDQLLNQAKLLYEPENLDFAARVDDSLLPIMLKELSDQDILPVFVRQRYRYHSEAAHVEEQELTQYLTDLEGYVTAHGGVYIDLIELESLQRDFFRDSLHLKSDSAEEASRLIAEFVRQKLGEKHGLIMDD